MIQAGLVINRGSFFFFFSVLCNFGSLCFISFSSFHNSHDYRFCISKYPLKYTTLQKGYFLYSCLSLIFYIVIHFLRTIMYKTLFESLIGIKAEPVVFPVEGYTTRSVEPYPQRCSCSYFLLFTFCHCFFFFFFFGVSHNFPSRRIKKKLKLRQLMARRKARLRKEISRAPNVFKDLTHLP